MRDDGEPAPGITGTGRYLTGSHGTTVAELTILPVGAHVPLTAQNATIALDMGFTSAVGAGQIPRRRLPAAAGRPPDAIAKGERGSGIG